MRVARWYGSQESVVRSSLEKAEPFTWLKHLDKRNTRPPERSPRHLSALIMEEYIHAQLRHDSMKSIPEDSAVYDSAPDLSISPSLVNAQLFSTPSRPSSHYSADPSSARQRSSEGRITFEPQVESTRNSVEVESLRSGESSHSSMISRPSSSAIYPANTGFQARDVAPRISKKLAHDKDEISSSAEDYPSVHSEPSGYKYGGAKLSGVESKAGSDIKVIVSEVPSETIPKVESEMKQPMPATGLVDHISETISPPSPNRYRHGTTDRAPQRRRGLTSLPPTRRPSRLGESIRQQESDNERAHERKTR